MPVRWNKQALSELSPRRGEARPQRLDHDPEAVESWLKAGFAGCAPLLQAGIARGPAEARPLTERVIAAGYELAPDMPLEATVQGALAGLPPLALPRELLRYWMARGGLAFAIEACFALATLRPEFPRVDGKRVTDACWISPAAPDRMFERLGPDARSELVRAIACASGDEYAAVVRTIGELRGRAAGPSLRCDLDALVPTERAWASDDVRAQLIVETASGRRYLGAAARLFPALDLDLGETLLAELATKIGMLAIGVFDAVRALEERALPHLVRAIETLEPRSFPTIGVTEPQLVARALALFDDVRAATALMPWIGVKAMGLIAVDHLRTFPALAVRVLAPSLLEKTRRAEASQALLAQIVRGDGAAAAQGLEGLPAAQRTAVQRLLDATAQSESKEVAPREALPAVLRDPPWRNAKSRPVLPVIENLPPLAYEARVVWAGEAERARVAKIPGWVGRTPLFGQEMGAFEDRLKKEAAGPPRPGVDGASAEVDIAMAKRLREGLAWASPSHNEAQEFSEIGYMLARSGPSATTGAVACALSSMSKVALEALFHCDSPAVAPVAAKGLPRRALHRACAAWLEQRTEAAAIGLLPIALAGPSPARADALSALRHVAGRGARSTVLSVAGRWGERAAQAAAEVLDCDPIFDCPRSPPSLSGFASVDGVPAVLLADGRRLSDEATRNLLEMLQFTSFVAPYAGVAQVHGSLDAASVDRLLLSLVDAWIAAGGTGATAWPLRAIAHLGSDAIAAETAAFVRRWVREKGKPRALIAVEVLGRMGTDAALMHLFDLSKTSRNKAIEEAATAALTEASQARGLIGDELEDRLTPSLGLDAKGTTSLDFGSRRFVVRVDEQLLPIVFDGEARLPSLPRTNKTDDAESARAAAKRFKVLKADLDTAGKTLVMRLERAMVSGRRWPLDEFRTLLVAHPLAGRLVRRLVLGVFEGQGRTAPAASFRVAEDATFAGPDDATYVVPEHLGHVPCIGIPHPLELPSDERSRWARIFGDYEIVQPFDQIARATFAFTEEERAAKALTRFAGREIPSGPFLGRLETRGWRRGPVDSGWITTFEKDFAGVEATVNFSPSLEVGGKPPDKCKLGSVTLDGAKLGDLPAVMLSEIGYDLAPLGPR